MNAFLFLGCLLGLVLCQRPPVSYNATQSTTNGRVQLTSITFQGLTLRATSPCFFRPTAATRPDQRDAWGVPDVESDPKGQNADERLLSILGDDDLMTYTYNVDLDDTIDITFGRILSANDVVLLSDHTVADACTLQLLSSGRSPIGNPFSFLASEWGPSSGEFSTICRRDDASKSLNRNNPRLLGVSVAEFGSLTVNATGVRLSQCTGIDLAMAWLYSPCTTTSLKTTAAQSQPRVTMVGPPPTPLLSTPATAVQQSTQRVSSFSDSLTTGFASATTSSSEASFRTSSIAEPSPTTVGGSIGTTSSDAALTDDQESVATATNSLARQTEMSGLPHWWWIPLAAILACLLIVLLAVLVIVLKRRGKEAPTKPATSREGTVGGDTEMFSARTDATAAAVAPRLRTSEYASVSELHSPTYVAAPFSSSQSGTGIVGASQSQYMSVSRTQNVYEAVDSPLD